MSGFHHDLMNVFEKSGLIEFVNKVINEYGVYQADLKIGETIIRGKTFFPAHWTREKVVSAIYEAYENFRSNGGAAKLNPDGKYCIRGITSDHIEVEMFITKNGKITTAYPVLQ